MQNRAQNHMEKTDGPVHELQSKANRAQEKLEKSGSLNEIKSAAARVIEATSERIQDGRDYVKENPTKSVALATALGVVVGFFTSLFLRQKKD